MAENIFRSYNYKKEINVQQTRHLFNEILHNAKDSIVLVEVKEDGDLGNFLEVNDMLCRKLGYCREELLNMTVYDIETNKREIIEERVKMLLVKGRIVFESNFTTKVGKNYPIEVSSHVFIFNGKKIVLGIVRDITIEKELYETEERYCKLVELLPDAIHVKQNGKIVFTNDAGAKLLGVKNKEELIGRNDLEFTHPDYYRISIERGNEMRKKNNKVAPIEQKCVRVDGKVLDVEVASTSITFNRDHAILSVLRDISERKEWEERLQKALQENKNLLKKAIELDKQKTEFFSNISHEFKTPLNVILGTIQLIEKFIKDNEIHNDYVKIYKYMGTMKQNCYRLLRLINNLIDINKADSKFIEGNFCNCDIIRIIEDITLSVADFGSNKGLTIIFDTEIEEKTIACDVDKIERIMLNLLSNAIKYTEAGGTIYVNIYDKEEHIIVNIKDTGIGIPKNKLQSIFERFEQIDSSMRRMNEGSGIGLSLVKSFVEIHGGKIWVDSELGCGTQFFIELPSRQIPQKDLNCNYEDYSADLVERISIEFSDIYA